MCSKLIIKTTERRHLLWTSKCRLARSSNIPKLISYELFSLHNSLIKWNWQLKNDVTPEELTGIQTSVFGINFANDVILKKQLWWRKAVSLQGVYDKCSQEIEAIIKKSLAESVWNKAIVLILATLQTLVTITDTFKRDFPRANF